MARPPKSPDKLRSKDLRVRLTPEEHRAVADAADLDGGEISDWVRPIIIEAARAALAKKQRSAKATTAPKPIG
jgi:uncharacterized protein (DUF1778 family)